MERLRFIIYPSNLFAISLRRVISTYGFARHHLSFPLPRSQVWGIWGLFSDIFCVLQGLIGPLSWKACRVGTLQHVRATSSGSI